jgi:uncharacterized membrane protein
MAQVVSPVVQPILALVGLVLIFFAPGFFIVRALAPERRDPVGTVLIAIAASVATTVLLGSALGFLGAFEVGPLLVTLLAATAIFAAVAYFRGGLGPATLPAALPAGGDLMRAAMEARARRDRRAAEDAEGRLEELRRHGGDR